MRLLGALLRAPALTGAVVPSSRFLATAMARQARGAASRIELGAGTGPVTRALVRDDKHSPLTVVELQPSLARKLTRDFPSARVLAQPAAQVLRAERDVPLPCALVSSLPFRSLPLQVREETQEGILGFIEEHPGSWLVQFTYQPRAPFSAPEGYEWELRATVLANLPPAGVWVLKRKP